MLDSMISTGRVTVLPDEGCEATLVLTGAVQVCKRATFMQQAHIPHLEDVPALVDAYETSGQAASCISGFIRGHTARISVEWKLVKHQWLEQVAAKRTLAAVVTSIRERTMVRCMHNREVERQARRAVRRYDSMLRTQHEAMEAAAPQWVDTAKRWPGGPPAIIGAGAHS